MQSSITPVLPDYYGFNDLLQSNQLLVDAALAHGIICSLVCVGNLMDGQLWLELLLGVTGGENAMSSECRQALIELYDITSRQLQDTDLTFQMLLPTDDLALEQRVKALGRWCQGFLQGLQLADVNGEEVDEDEVMEFIDDIADIAHIDYDTVQPLSEDETNYMEIVEYLRVGVMMVYYEYSGLEDTQGKQHRSELH